MEKQLRKIRRYLGIIDEARTFNGRAIDGITILPCPYKEGTKIPPEGDFRPFNSGDVWGEGWDTHAWFDFTFTVPEEMRGNDDRARPPHRPHRMGRGQPAVHGVHKRKAQTGT